MQGGSSEEQRYLSSIKREKEAFKKLIMEKSTMLVPTPNLQAPTTDSTTALNESHVIVDVREFRSSLPSFLHEKGYQLDAVTLTVGDFILTPNICVERKSISDLFGSFK
jgi:DNA excision repair protein ERCC-4